MSDYSEERVAKLLRLLQPAPAAWVVAAAELPRARMEYDDIVARAEQDAAFRAALIADLEAALVAEGYTPRPRLLDELRQRLTATD